MNFDMYKIGLVYIICRYNILSHVLLATLYGLMCLFLQVLNWLKLG